MIRVFHDLLNKKFILFFFALFDHFFKLIVKIVLDLQKKPSKKLVKFVSKKTFACHPPTRTRTRDLRISPFLQSYALPTELSAVVCVSGALICSPAIVWSFFIWKPWLRHEENKQKFLLMFFKIQGENLIFFALYNHIVKRKANIW